MIEDEPTIVIKVACWNAVSAPGPLIDQLFEVAAVPREGEQIEINDENVPGVPGGVYYVHRVRHVYAGIGGEHPSLAAHVEVTTASPWDLR